MIAGPCKSAGTLIAIAADELSFGLFGEIGPLDIQIIKPEELLWISGLDTMEGLDVVGDRLFRLYDKYMQSILERSGPRLSFRTVNELAQRLASEFVRPIAAQIDPYRLGEVERLMRIARIYAERLNRGNITKQNIHKLVTGYPSHDFIIDDTEARNLFQKCRQSDALETKIAMNTSGFLLTPLPEPVIMDLALTVPAESEEGSDSNGANKAKKSAQRTRKRPRKPASAGKPPAKSEGSASERSD